jgi:hypothetical protein
LPKWFQPEERAKNTAVTSLMRKELKRFLIEGLFIGDVVADRRVNFRDRRRLNTFLFCDRRSGLADKRAKNSELIKRFLFGYNCERRRANGDRRILNSYIVKDRRSGIADRRPGSWLLQFHNPHHPAFSNFD